MASVIPTIQVLLDDGSGTYPTDITGRVSLAAGVSVSGHGRTDEFSTAGAAQFSCTLRNDDGGLSNALGFGLGPFGVTPFGGLGVPVYPGQGIRYKETKGATTSTVFTGQISSLELGWTGGTGKASVVNLIAVDPFAALGKRAALRSLLEQEILLDGPTAYYTLGEAEGSTSAGDTSGRGCPTLAIAGTGAALAFAAATGPVDELGAPTFGGGQYLSGAGTVYVPVGAAKFMLRAEFATTTASGEQLATLDDQAVSLVLNAIGQAYLGVDNSGHLVTIISAPGGSASVTSAATVTDGLTHQAALSLNGSTLSLWLDGVVVGTTALSFSIPASYTRLSVGGSPTNAGAQFPGTVSHVAVYQAEPSAARMLEQRKVVVGTPETVAARFARLASYVGAPVTTTGMSGQMMAAQATSGVAPLDALQAAADAEGGVLFCRGDGTLVLQGRGYRAAKTAPTLTVPLKDIGASTSLTTDTQQVLNSVTVTRTGGATQLVTNAGSIASYGIYSESRDLAVADDASALAAAQWLVASHASPVTRMGSVTVSLLTSSQAEQVMAAEVGDRWALSGLPAQTWTGFGDLIVEGWSRTLTVSESGAEWSMSLNLLPWSLFTALILDDPTYGALDLIPLGY